MTPPTEEELAPPIGFFLYADSYWLSARSLSNLNLRTPHATAPVYFLYHQAVELYLKACLRLHGQKVLDIKGHKILPLSRKTQKFGLSFGDEDLVIFGLLDSSEVVMTARYLKVGFYSRPSIEGLERTCKSIRDLVATQMKQAGLSIRPFPRLAPKS